MGKGGQTGPHPNPWALLVIRRGLEVRVERHHFGDQVVPLLFQLLAGAKLSGVEALPLAVVNRLGGRGPAGEQQTVTPRAPDPSRPLNNPSTLAQFREEEKIKETTGKEGVNSLVPC